MNNTVKIVECRQSAGKSWLTPQRPYAGLDLILPLCYLLEKPSLKENTMWATYYSKCTECKSTRYPHMAKGKCSSCYSKNYRSVPKNWKRIQEKKQEWYDENVRGTDYSKMRREQKHFGGKREKVLKRDGYQCTECGSLEKLVVHHRDGRGRGYKDSKNSMINLTTLCKACHVDVHRAELLEARKRLKVMYWSPKHKLKGCKDCGTSDIKHQGRGYCSNCYARYLRKNSLVVRRYGPNSMAT